ncbi:hypothetical protein BB559_002255 [Furculomyces boomerangus]|uniref:Sec1-like protein n=1 Tax=Furculomyces boomerangus TaxID=61424 RepID=A0A2T9YWT2_9FUNG|nr:hypothetical protein BB559_002255 [Furculomyces boomerangus]
MATVDLTSIKYLLKNKILESIRAVKPPGKWKVVVVDKQSLKLISSVLKLYDILEEDVSLVETITKSRQPYTDKEAIYFLTPTKESVSRFIDDFTKKGPGWNKGAMYAGAHLFFTGALDDAMFTRLATSKPAKYIKSIKELFIQFNAYESKVFLTTPSAYPFYNMYSPNANESRDRDIAATVDRLVCVLATLNSNPYVRYYNPQTYCPRYEKLAKSKTQQKFLDDTQNLLDGNQIQHSKNVPIAPSIAKKMAEAFQTKYKDFVKNDPENTALNSSDRQDVIIFLDRSVDMYSPLLHEFTYQAMVNDLLDLEQGKKYKQELEQDVVLDEEIDKMWAKYRHYHIADTIDDISKSFKQLVGENKILSTVGKSDAKTTLSQMKKILESIPEFQELQDTYSTHINLTKMCMSIFDSFGLSEIGSIEQDLVTGVTPDGDRITDDIDADLIRVLANHEMEETDRIRLLMIYLVAKDGIKDIDRRRLQEVLECMNIDDKRGLLNMNLLNVRTDRNEGEVDRTSSELYKWPKYIENEKAKFDLSRFVPAMHFIIESQVNKDLDENLFPWLGEKPSTEEKVTPIHLMGSLRSTKKEWKNQSPTNQNGNIIIFMVGGVTYSEIRTIYKLSKKLKKNIYIGSTHITTPRDFLEDLKTLRRKIDQPKIPIISSNIIRSSIIPIHDFSLLGPKLKASPRGFRSQTPI